MLAKDSLKDLLHQSGLANTDKLLLCLSVDADTAKAVLDIKRLAVDAGLRGASKWNVSAMLGRSKGMAIRTNAGWELTSAGRERVATIAGPLNANPTRKVSASLRAQLAGISGPDSAAFVEEAISCFESGLFRAAVVLSWVGAVSVLYGEVVGNHLAAFNAEAVRRNAKWRPAKTVDDLARMKESDFLDLAEAISTLGKSVKQELQGCLTLRNGCGHPNTLKLAEHRVASHIEVLILNVFAVFGA